mmetsp:Transcript_1811/g.1704  ORF Transcript_1811/g.1704 Transcript_1811/m.1704 type:complete len:139 (-) Transcript_1811:551-967(-)
MIEELKRQNIRVEKYDDKSKDFDFSEFEEKLVQITQKLKDAPVEEILGDLDEMKKDLEEMEKDATKYKEELSTKIKTYEEEQQKSEKNKALMDYLNKINSQRENVKQLFNQSVVQENALIDKLEGKMKELESMSHKNI